MYIATLKQHIFEGTKIDKAFCQKLLKVNRDTTLQKYDIIQWEYERLMFYAMQTYQLVSTLLGVCTQTSCPGFETAFKTAFVCKLHGQQVKVCLFLLIEWR